MCSLSCYSASTLVRSKVLLILLLVKVTSASSQTVDEDSEMFLNAFPSFPKFQPAADLPINLVNADEPQRLTTTTPSMTSSAHEQNEEGSQNSIDSDIPRNPGKFRFIEEALSMDSAELAQTLLRYARDITSRSFKKHVLENRSFMNKWEPVARSYVGIGQRIHDFVQKHIFGAQTRLDGRSSQDKKQWVIQTLDDTIRFLLREWEQFNIPNEGRAMSDGKDFESLWIDTKKVWKNLSNDLRQFKDRVSTTFSSSSVAREFSVGRQLGVDPYGVMAAVGFGVFIFNVVYSVINIADMRAARQRQDGTNLASSGNSQSIFDTIVKFLGMGPPEVRNIEPPAPVGPSLYFNRRARGLKRNDAKRKEDTINPFSDDSIIEVPDDVLHTAVELLLEREPECLRMVTCEVLASTVPGDNIGSDRDKKFMRSMAKKLNETEMSNFDEFMGTIERRVAEEPSLNCSEFSPAGCQSLDSLDDEDEEYEDEEESDEDSDYEGFSSEGDEKPKISFDDGIGSLGGRKQPSVIIKQVPILNRPKVHSVKENKAPSSLH